MAKMFPTCSATKMPIEPHSYTVLKGTDRATVGRWLGVIAGILSSFAVFAIASATTWFEALGLPASLSPALFALTSAAMIYRGLVYLFDRWLWKTRPIQKLMCWPSLAGRWEVQGKTAPESGGYEWEGLLTISQTWSEISVVLQTTQSRSGSVAATIAVEPDGNLKLLYNYNNAPRPLEGQLQAHQGFGDIQFLPDLSEGLVVYFNGRGRRTFGEMTLVRRAD